MESTMTPRFSVSDFLAVTNQALDVAFGVVEVEGEVSAFKVNHQKYVFFDLKDADGTVNCFMTVWQLRVPVEDGMKVVVRATPKITQWGRFSLTVQSIRPIGEGSLKKSYDLLREKLEKDGLFSPEHKRPLPHFPERIAVISSTQSAGYADFMKVARQRWGGGHFIVANVRVQGDGAADEIIQALQYINQMEHRPEVVVIIRGGGSQDDLSIFNDEPLVRAVAESAVPVLAGIGHEVDEVLVDFAADVRAATPSNAAELLFPDKKHLKATLHVQIRSTFPPMYHLLREQQTAAHSQAQHALRVWRERVDDAASEIAHTRKLVQEYNPARVLARGYALIRGVREVGETVEITTDKEIMKARIEEYESTHH